MTTSPLAAKSQPLHLLHLKNCDIFDQLQIEEALLRADNRNWCVINSGSAPSIVMGISGKPEQLLDAKLINEKPVPVIRRFSGGGTVFIDEHTVFVTWILNADHSLVNCCPSNMHAWSANFYSQAWPLLGMKLQENDYVIHDRKFAGNAQYICKGRWLHHSSFLWDYNHENMAYLKMPPKIPVYRQKRDHVDFLCKLKSYFSDKESLETQLLGSIHSQFDVRKMDFEEVLEISKRQHRQATCYV